MLRDESTTSWVNGSLAMWAYGGTMSVDEPADVADPDTHATLARLDEATTAVIEAAQDAIASATASSLILDVPG